MKKVSLSKGLFSNSMIMGMLFLSSIATAHMTEKVSAANSGQVVKKEEAIVKLWPMAQVRPVSAINGLWRVPLNNGKCFELYNFTPDNQVFIYSNAERIVGTYEVQPLDTGLASNLIIRVNYDNARVDCEGKDRNQSGEVMTMSMVKSPDKQHMQWCEQNNAQNCFLELDRVLP